MEYSKEIFGRNLTHYMNMKGIDRYQLADKLGVAYTTVSEWCVGNKFPRLDKLEMISNILGVRKSALIEDHTEDLTLDDFNYALFQETKDLTPENKRQLLEMARFFKAQQK